MNSFKNNWLTNMAAVSLIVFSVVGSLSLVSPYSSKQMPTTQTMARQIIVPKQHPMTNTLHDLGAKDAMNFKKEPNGNTFRSVKRVTA